MLICTDSTPRALMRSASFFRIKIPLVLSLMQNVRLRAYSRISKKSRRIRISPPLIVR